MPSHYGDAADRLHERLLARIWKKPAQVDPPEDDIDQVKRALRREWIVPNAVAVLTVFR